MIIGYDNMIIEETLESVETEDIYRTLPPEAIPWNIETPPKTLVELVESEKIKPCKAIDLGCGAGHYAIYLAGRGFDITGIDISPTAIKIAREKAEKENAKCIFIVADVLGSLDEVKDTFDFAYDWSLLHHVYPEHRKKYIENVNRILNSGGKYLSVCFSEKDPQFGGSGKYRKTPLGTILYFSSEEELRELFSACFKIIELKTIQIEGKFSPHLADYAFMEKK
jgi:SAM-dependent methyltransferase